jgi:hypothetical protein
MSGTWDTVRPCLLPDCRYADVVLAHIVEAAKEIIRTEGVKGLLGRGLPTRLLANGLQGLLFSVLWKLFSDL